MGQVGKRVILARRWRISPAAVRECTLEEVAAMWAMLGLEDRANGG